MKLPLLFREFPKKYGRIFALQSGGTFAAVLIPIFAAPVITRLYSPAEYAVLAAYMLVTTLAAPVAMLRYDAAILMPFRKTHALSVASLALCCVAATAALLTGVMLISPDLIPGIVGENGMRTWQLLIPPGVLVGALTVLSQTLALREGAYKALAISRIVGAALTSGTAVGSGLMGFDAGALLVAQLVGGASAFAILTPTLRRNFRFLPGAAAPKRLGWVANRYRRFPLISLPGDFLGNLGAQGHLLAVSLLFGSATLGALALGQRMVGVTSSVLGKAIGEVFRREAARQWNESGDFHQFYLAMLMWMSLFAVIIYAPLLVLSPWLFKTIFGEEWEAAGQYISILAPYFAFQFIGGNLGYTVYIVERQEVDIYIQLSILGALGVATFVAMNTHSIEFFLVTLSASMCLVYTAYITLCLRLSYGKSVSHAVAS